MHEVYKLDNVFTPIQHTAGICSQHTKLKIEVFGNQSLALEVTDYSSTFQ